MALLLNRTRRCHWNSSWLDMLCVDCNRQEVFQDQCPVRQLTDSYHNFTSASVLSLVLRTFARKNTFMLSCKTVETPKMEPGFFIYICSAHVSGIMKAKIQRSFLRLILHTLACLCGWCFTQMRTQLWTVRIDLSHQQFQQIPALLFIFTKS